MAKHPPVPHPYLNSLYSVAVAIFIRIDAYIYYYTMPSKSAVESLGALSRCPCVRAMGKVPSLVSEIGKGTSSESEVSLAPQFRG